MYRMTIFLLLFLLLHNTTSVKILSITNVDKEEKFNVSLKDPPKLKDPKLTICIWIKPVIFNSNLFFGFGGDFTKIYLYENSFEGRQLFLNLCERCETYYIDLSEEQRILPHTWVHLCIQLSGSESSIKLYLNANLVFDKVNVKSMENLRLEEDYIEENVRFTIYSMYGNRTGLQLWSTLLSNRDIGNVYQCNENQPKADVLEWKDVEFDIVPATDKIKLVTIPDEEGPCEEHAQEEDMYSF